MKKKHPDSQDVHSAVSSWSGYDFQGQVAIYTVLCYLNELKSRINDISEYSLEIEHLEDFSIKKNDCYISLHQVKSYQDKYLFSSYKEAILELLGKCAKYKVVESVNLHTTSLIEKPTKNEMKRILSEYIPIKKIEKLNEYKHSMFELNKFDEVYEKLFFNKCEDSLPYSHVVDIDEIGDQIKQQLYKFYSIYSSEIKFSDSLSPIYFTSDDNINFIYHNLQSELDKWIIKNHKKISEDPEISFSVFYEILLSKNIFTFSNKTTAGLLKEALKKCYSEYCEDHEISQENDPICHNWERNWDYIRQLNDDDFILLCRKISPNVLVKSRTITLVEYRELLNSRGVKEALIHLTLEIGNLSLELTDVKNVFVLNNLGSHHLISTISEGKAPKAVDNVSKRIIKNLKEDSNLSHLLFDIHKIITTDLDGTFDGEIFDIKSTYHKELSKKLDNKTPIMIPKKLDFISLEIVKEELK
ncbi:ABC-three component system protein [Paenibacillus cucumis (ex Kampfer et al. 2016)]|uniref:ABC-three component systems C-terminal domain-containing protein n=1 Tax=Paenibacillus cucumis (ex Kampfer et al. 2016) TaxID=1776858 RepID=A0ABS7KF18_9BACL|nr:ABC-three component system protein [Paenibacillus cucumis (ex Kampfer et al. 2016)]MBY0202733.1 hypothetical protein [Paenibacillus cucumis (ex Kampfer et al. 2016)]